MDIAEALKAVQERINNSAVKTGRDSDNIRLVAVSKTVELQRIILAVKAGVSILGENRVQEAREKISNFKFSASADPLEASLSEESYRPEAGQITPPIPALEKGGVEWHLIGNLQKNKAKTALQLFDLIHSLDSLSLADVLNNYGRQTGKRQRILVQVKPLDDVTKHGISEKGLMELVEKISGMKNLKLEGLMTMPPFFEDPEKTRPYFSRLRQLAEKLSEKGFPVNELSMGMSNDFEVAIEEGATLVRIGTAIFGKRPSDEIR
ncbi:MAG: YggS family pyridoxal phosphate-dependent enzyme [Candidatus Mariimomonas ferrooxydans]